MQDNDIKYKVGKLLKQNIDQITNSDQLKKKMDNGLLDVDVWEKGKYIPLNEELKIYELEFNDEQDLKKYYNNKIRNQLLTRKGEIPNDSEFGSVLYDYVFFNEKNFSIDQVKTIIMETIKEFVPEVVIESLDDIIVKKVYDDQTGDFYIFITINYTIPYIGKTYLNLKLDKN